MCSVVTHDFRTLSALSARETTWRPLRSSSMGQKLLESLHWLCRREIVVWIVVVQHEGKQWALTNMAANIRTVANSPVQPIRLKQMKLPSIYISINKYKLTI